MMQPETCSLPIDTIICGDALAEMQRLPDASVDAIITDPPYFKVKGEAWDRQWEKPEQFLAWIETLCREWKRLLKPNGSLYVFASPQMAARVEVVMRQHFNVLNRIRWVKRQGWHQKARKEDLRAYLSNWEEILFAEHYNSDNYALDGSGYAAKCDELRGFTFESIRAYLEGERKRAGIKKEDCNAACGFARIAGGMASRHYFSPSQWCLPTREHYAALQRLFNQQGRKPAPPFVEFHSGEAATRYHARGRGEYLRANYEDLRANYEDLRANYEDLRANYEDLRRPFHVSADVSYTDVWNFETVAYYPGKHPCEKPLPLLEHIIQASTRPGALILDCFAGSGSLCEAAQRLERRFIGIDASAAYVAQARARVSRRPIVIHQPTPLSAKIIPLAARRRKRALPANVEQLALFA